MATIEQSFGEFWVRALERRGITVVGNTITPPTAQRTSSATRFLNWLARRYRVTLPP